MKYKSEIYEVVHQDAIEMYKIGAISEEKMHEYDQMCLVTEVEADELEKPGITAAILSAPSR